MFWKRSAPPPGKTFHPMMTAKGGKIALHWGWGHGAHLFHFPPSEGPRPKPHQFHFPQAQNNAIYGGRTRNVYCCEKIIVSIILITGPVPIASANLYKASANLYTIDRLVCPLEPSKALQDRPRTLQELPGSPPGLPQDPPGPPREPPRGPQDAPRTPPRPPQDAPGTPQERRTTADVMLLALKGNIFRRIST